MKSYKDTLSCRTVSDYLESAESPLNKEKIFILFTKDSVSVHTTHGEFLTTLNELQLQVLLELI